MHDYTASLHFPSCFFRVLTRKVCSFCQLDGRVPTDIVISWACMGIEFQQWPEESSNIQNFEVWWNFWRLSSNWMWVNVRYWRLLHHGYTWHTPGVVSQRTSWNTECARQFQQSSILCRAAVMFWQSVATLRSCSKLIQTAWGLDSRCLPQPAGSRATNLGKATVSHWNQQHVFRFVPLALEVNRPRSIRLVWTLGWSLPWKMTHLMTWSTFHMIFVATYRRVM